MRLSLRQLFQGDAHNKPLFFTGQLHQHVVQTSFQLQPEVMPFVTIGFLLVNQQQLAIQPHLDSASLGDGKQVVAGFLYVEAFPGVSDRVGEGVEVVEW